MLHPRPCALTEFAAGLRKYLCDAVALLPKVTLPACVLILIYIYSGYGNEGGCECDNICVAVKVNLGVNMSVRATASMRTRAHYDVGMSRSRSPFIQSIVKQSFCASSSYKYSVRDFNDRMRLLTIHIISHKPAV